MKRILVHNNTIVESRLYKAGEYIESDIPMPDLDALLSGRHASIVGDAPSGAPIVPPFMTVANEGGSLSSSSSAPERGGKRK